MKTIQSNTEEQEIKINGCCSSPINKEDKSTACCEQPSDGSSCCNKGETKEINIEKTGCC